MKFRHRIKFTIDNISLHGKQVRAGIFMSFFAFLVTCMDFILFINKQTDKIQTANVRTNPHTRIKISHATICSDARHPSIMLI